MTGGERRDEEETIGERGPGEATVEGRPTGESTVEGRPSGATAERRTGGAATEEGDVTIDRAMLAQARVHARTVDDDLGVDLDRVEWDVSARAKRRAGVCRWNADAGVATIVLARRAYRAYDAEAFEAVVRHELIHAWEFQRFGESGHGPRFREQAARLGAPRHCESFAEPRYVLRCLDDDCDWTAGRHRASGPVKTPSRYRCGRCGGAYAVEHVASGRSWTTASGYGGAKAALGDDW